MADPAAQFQTAGIQSPYYTPVETRLPAQQFFTPISPWSGVADAIKNATDTIMKSPLNPQVRNQMQLSNMYTQSMQKEYQDYQTGKSQWNPAWSLGMGPGGVTGQPVISANAQTLGYVTTPSDQNQNQNQNQQPQVQQPQTPQQPQVNKPQTPQQPQPQVNKPAATDNTAANQPGQIDRVQLAQYIRNEESHAAGKNLVSDPLVSVQQNSDGSLTEVRKSGKTSPLSYQDGWNIWQRNGGKLQTSSTDSSNVVNPTKSPTATNTTGYGSTPTPGFKSADSTTSTAPGVTDTIPVSQQVDANGNPIPAQTPPQPAGTPTQPGGGMQVDTRTPEQIAASLQGGGQNQTPQQQPQQPAQVTHPVLSSQAALDWAKTRDTGVQRAIYHENGPNGEPGFTFVSKGGGSSYVPVSKIAASNPGLVLGDNLGHGLSGAATGNAGGQAVGQPGGGQNPPGGMQVDTRTPEQIAAQFQGTGPNNANAVAARNDNVITPGGPPQPAAVQPPNANAPQVPTNAPPEAPAPTVEKVGFGGTRTIQPNVTHNLQFAPPFGNVTTQTPQQQDIEALNKAGIPMVEIQQAIQNGTFARMKQQYANQHMTPWENPQQTQNQLVSSHQAAQYYGQLKDNIATIINPNNPQNKDGGPTGNQRLLQIRNWGTVMNLLNTAGFGTDYTSYLNNYNAFMQKLKDWHLDGITSTLFPNGRGTYTQNMWDQGMAFHNSLNHAVEAEKAMLHAKGESDADIDYRIFNDFGQKNMTFHVGAEAGLKGLLGVSASGDFTLPMLTTTSDIVNDGEQRFRGEYQAQAKRMDDMRMYVPDYVKADMDGYQKTGRVPDSNAEAEARKDGYTPHEPDPNDHAPAVINPPTVQPTQPQPNQPQPNQPQPVVQPQPNRPVVQPQPTRPAVVQPPTQPAQPAVQGTGRNLPGPAPFSPANTNYYQYGRPGTNDMGPSGRPLFAPRQTTQPPPAAPAPTVKPPAATKKSGGGATQKPGGGFPAVQGVHQETGVVDIPNPKLTYSEGPNNQPIPPAVQNNTRGLPVFDPIRGWVHNDPVQDAINERNRQDAINLNRLHSVTPQSDVVPGRNYSDHPAVPSPLPGPKQGAVHDVSHLSSNDIASIVPTVPVGTYLNMDGQVAVKGNDGLMHRVA